MNRPGGTGAPRIGRRTALLAAASAAGCGGPAEVAAQGGAGGAAPAGLRLENAGSRSLPAGIATFGHVFLPGELPRGAGLQAGLGGGAPQPAQADVKTRWPDGSAQMAVVAVARPELASGRVVGVALAAGAGAPADEVALAEALAGHSLLATLAFEGATSPFRADLFELLRAALAGGRASYWQRGKLASAARVEAAVPGTSLRLVCDVTAYAGGGLAADLQFANDRAMEAAGGRLTYAANVVLDGRQVIAERVEQLQYQVWRRRVATGADGGQGSGSPGAGWLNVRHDLRRLIEAGAVARYDTTLRVSAARLADYGRAIAGTGWRAPLAANGVTKYMPTGGGRADIGFTTEHNTIWLLSGDARVAAFAIGQAEASGAVPWRYWDARRNSWVHAGNYPRLWTDPRGGVGRPGDPDATGPTQYMEWTGYEGWVPEQAHQPDLSFVPYILTGERWMLDNLLAQAAWNTVANWPSGERQNSLTRAADLVVSNVEVRAAAWSMRQVEHAAWAAPDGSPERGYFRRVADANWRWLVAQTPAWTEMQGNSHGWLPNYWWRGGTAPWQQDFLASTAILAARRGSTEARSFLDWMTNFLIGRFEQPAEVFSPRDGIANTLGVTPRDPATREPVQQMLKSWAELGAQMRQGASNFGGWERSQGYYGQLGLASLAGVFQLTGEPRARTAYARLVALNPPFTMESDLAASPSFAVTIPELLRGPRR